MSHDKWIQEDFVQAGTFFTRLINGIKLIFKNPNNRPFKKASVYITLEEASVGKLTINTKGMVHCYFDIQEASVGKVVINTLDNVHCYVTLINESYMG